MASLNDGVGRPLGRRSSIVSIGMDGAPLAKALA